MTRTQAILAETMRQAMLLANDTQTSAIMASVSAAPTICSDPTCSRMKPCIDHPEPSRSTWEGHGGRHGRMRSGSREQRRARYVLRRDNGICHICGRPLANEVDHIVPTSEGGPDTLDNLAPIHREPCHRDKTAAEATRARERARQARTERQGGGG